MEKPFAITLDVGSSHANKTGSWRTERPVYVDRMPPCNSACPAGENIQSWLYMAEEGGDGYERAWRKIMEANPFPAVIGRVCYHPCETACNRATLDAAVGINEVERFLGDLAIERGWSVQVEAAPTGKRVLVVGAGPAGLSAAYHLALLGHEVTVRDAGPKPGGMMRFGIPRYRLPREVLDAEIARIQALGVRIETETTVHSAFAAMRDGGFDAVFVAVGAQIGKRAYVPAGDAAHIVDAVTLLHSMEDETRPALGRRVAVYGGGNTAMDVARTAKRLGSAEAIVIYRRTRDRMPAHDFEVEEAEEEGIQMKWLSSVKHADSGKLVLERMGLDGNGFPQPTGEYEELAADSLILALGQESDLSLLDDIPGIVVDDGAVHVGDDLMTGHPGIFAGGDTVPAERTVTVGVGHGKKAARSIDAWLRRGTPTLPTPPQPVNFEQLNTWYYADAPRAMQPVLELARRRSTFAEVVGGLDETTALFEARRCMSCGNCFHCDNCFAVCPDNAVLKIDDANRAYAIDYDYCKGCGICAAECPCGAIEMIPEEV